MLCISTMPSRRLSVVWIASFYSMLHEHHDSDVPHHGLGSLCEKAIFDPFSLQCSHRYVALPQCQMLQLERNF